MPPPQASLPPPQASAAHGAPIRILSLDGGGAKGFVLVEMLEEIERRCGGKPITELFDMIVGTSIGGAVALTLCVEASKGEQRRRGGLAVSRAILMRLCKDVFSKA